MEYSKVLLLMVFTTYYSVNIVQGYYNLNETNPKRFEYNVGASEEHQQKHFRSKELSRREPRFISFQTKDDNIEVEIDFAIPFLSIPVKRSLSGAYGTFSNMIKGIPMANINVGAIILTSLVIFGGSMIGGLSRLLNGGNFIEIAGSLPWFRNKKKQKRDDNEDDSSWMNIVDNIDKALLKYDLDTTTCVNRVICWKVKESLANVEDGDASNIDHIISGLSSSDWALQLISNTSWKSAVAAARSGKNSCATTFSQCKLNPKYLEYIAQKITKDQQDFFNFT